ADADRHGLGLEFLARRVEAEVAVGDEHALVLLVDHDAVTVLAVGGADLVGELGTRREGVHREAAAVGGRSGVADVE
ncbi:hypothetical protein CON46_29345, partial [Bacillus cereus]